MLKVGLCLGSREIWLSPHVLRGKICMYCGQCMSFHLDLLSALMILHELPGDMLTGGKI